MARLSSIGRATVPDSCTTLQDRRSAYSSSDDGLLSKSPPIFTAPAGLHSHFPLWGPTRPFIYFVQGTPPTNWTSGASKPVGAPRNE